MMMLGALSAPLKIDLCAAEPHIQDLGNFLNMLGANFKGLGTHDINVIRKIDKRDGRCVIES